MASFADDHELVAIAEWAAHRVLSRPRTRFREDKFLISALQLGRWGFINMPLLLHHEYQAVTHCLLLLYEPSRIVIAQEEKAT